MACDLHLHSTASDGGFTPSQVVEYASQIGLTCISLTDHDTFYGIPEAQKKADELGMPFIPGIEMTSVYEDVEIHILGYFLDCEEPSIKEALIRGKETTSRRLTAIAEKLTALGYPLTMDEVRSYAGQGSMGRPHLARAMLERGYVESIHEAFERFIGSDGVAYVPPLGNTPEEVYKLIRQAGGISAIAHPGLVGRADMMQENEILTHREWGAMAIEAFHPRHDDYVSSFYCNLAQKYRMGIVGGSDCHGSYYPKIMMNRKAVPDWVAEKFRIFSEKHKKASTGSSRLTMGKHQGVC
ncbi:MAG TPA: PHP domain-containing protein [Candidatus Sumerlaeota bacterium]|nr:PHP domain-containing protein [Candidatus Sumerlaeota bacterium]